MIDLRRGAHFLKEREPALDVVLLEQDICGGGPSGRNGGFVNDLAEEVETLLEVSGVEGAKAACEVSGQSVRELGIWCKEQGVDAWYESRPHVGVATSEAQDGDWQEWLGALDGLGLASGRVRELTAEDVRAICRSPTFRAGILLELAATVQPARLARGLRRVILEQGVRVFEGSPVRRFRAGRFAPSPKARRGGAPGRGREGRGG